jgi:enoyl-CoA hydratase/carnithine racemase
MELEATLFGLAAATPDAREGTGAFLERRAPVFRRPGADAART